jgi:hypothetical protein
MPPWRGEGQLDLYLYLYLAGSLTKTHINETGYFLRDFFLDFLTFEEGTGRLSRNVRIELPLYAAEYSRRKQIWFFFVFKNVSINCRRAFCYSVNSQVNQIKSRPVCYLWLFLSDS